MENLKEKEKYTLDDFRREVAGIIEREAQEGKTADFGGVKILTDNLTEDDMNIWIKINNGSVTEEDFEIYREIFKKEKGDESPVRHGFLSLAGNKANRIIGERWLAEERAKENK